MSAVDASTLTIDLPELYVAGVGVFITKLTLLDAVALKFNLNVSEAAITNVSSSARATFDSAAQQLNIPKLFFRNGFFDVTFGLTSTSGNTFEFTVVTIK